MSIKQRLRPLWVTLHWLMALLVFVAFGIGLFYLVNEPNTNVKLFPLGLHMALGIGILLLVIARCILRLLVFKPTRRSGDVPGRKKTIMLDKLTPYVHILLYLCTGLMAILGLMIAFPADLFAIAWGRSGAPLPADFYVYPARTWHGTLSLVLALLISQHILVAIYHQFVKRENYLGRMWFNKN